MAQLEAAEVMRMLEAYVTGLKVLGEQLVGSTIEVRISIDMSPFERGPRAEGP
ncbi:MAG: hypothetical protein V9G12_01900 [Microthrixaceae bacterium]